jgi:hypothetical protein
MQQRRSRKDAEVMYSVTDDTAYTAELLEELAAQMRTLSTSLKRIKL